MEEDTVDRWREFFGLPTSKDTKEELEWQDLLDHFEDFVTTHKTGFFTDWPKDISNREEVRKFYQEMLKWGTCEHGVTSPRRTRYCSTCRDNAAAHF